MAIHSISFFDILPDMQIKLSKGRYFKVNKKEITLELDLSEQVILLKTLYDNFKKLEIEDLKEPKVKEVVDLYIKKKLSSMFSVLDYTKKLITNMF